MNRASKLFQHIWSPLRANVRHHPYTVPFKEFLENSYPGTLYSKLNNGLTIATEQRDSAMVCIGLYIDGGSRYENEFENGIAHFFEHIAFKGTRNRKKNILLAELETVGNFRCFTEREMVCYYVQCLPCDVTHAVDLLSDCVLNNSLSREEIEMQKRIIYAEMIDQDEDTNVVLNDYLHAAAFQGTTLGRSVMGPSGNLYNFDYKTLAMYLSKLFIPTRMVLAAVGGIKHDTLVELAKCYMNNLEVTRCVEKPHYRYTGSEIRWRNDDLPACNAMIAVEGPCFCETDNVVMKVAAEAVSGWDRSMLRGSAIANRLARANSMDLECDAYRAFNINYSDTGLWGVQFMAEGQALDFVRGYIQEEWKYLCLCLTKNDLERAKRFTKAKLLSQMENVTKTCHDIGRWTLYAGCRPTIVQQINDIESITVDMMKEICNKYIYDKCPTVVAVGRTEGLFDYGRIRGGMYWLRY